MSQALEGGVKLPRVRSLSMNQAFSLPNEGSLETAKLNYYRHYGKLSDMTLPAPAKLWVLIDENPDSINDGAFAVGMDWPTTSVWADVPSILHDAGCSFAFADGHYELHKWSDRRTLAMNPTYSTTFSYVFSQPNNLDIKWVQDRTTAPKR
jgi:hypothetical protein